MTKLIDLMRFAAYCHTADMDVEELAFQKKLVEKTLEQFGVQNRTTLFIDQGCCPKSEVRPGLQRLLDAVDNQHFDCLVINQWSQIATSVDDVQALMRRFDSRGIVVLDATIVPAVIVGGRL